MRRWLLPALLAGVLLMASGPVWAAEILQVRSGQLLQVGDRNRTYTVELACVSIPSGGEQAATDWLRAALPRRTKVNLRPVGNDGGILVARVQRLGQSNNPSANDMGDALVSAGLARSTSGC